MASLFTKSGEAPDGRLKLLLWGPSASMKTTSALTLPSPAVVDYIEKGSDQYRRDFDYAYSNSNTIEEANQAVTEMAKGGHPYKTFIFDPLTLFCDSVDEKWLAYFRRIKNDPYYELQPSDHRGKNREIKSFIRRCQSLDMNVVMVCREKANFLSKWNPKKQKMEMVVDGVKPASLNDIIYEFDLVLKLTAVDGGAQWEKQKFRGSRYAQIPVTHTFKFGEFYNELCKFIGDKSQIESDATSTYDKMSPQSVLLMKLKELGIEDLGEKYEGYICTKYELASASDISADEIAEQRKILNSLTGNEERTNQFKALLQGTEGQGE